MAAIDFSARIAAFRGPLPGLEAQATMAPLPRPSPAPGFETSGAPLDAAVLILLYPKAGAPHIVFVRRPDTVLHHKSQIAFPGGQFEPGEDAVQAALREAEEEVGVPPARVRVFGPMTPLYVPPGHFCVHPVAGTSDEPLVFVPFPGEVAEILEVPLSRLLDPASVRRETWTLDRGPVLVPFFDIDGHKIWGATAMILAEFLEIVRRPD